METIPFLELLLDETFCRGRIYIPQEQVRMAGGINRRLKAKTKYELALRIAQKSPSGFLLYTEKSERDNLMELEEEPAEITNMYGWQTDCYVIGKYSSELRENGYFEAAINGVLKEAEAAGRYQTTLEYLEQMVGHGEAYYRIDEATQPILIYKGDAICHNVLTVFAEQLGQALEHAGELVEYFDFGREDVREVLRYKNRHFKAIIGVQSYLFSIKMQDELHYLHEYIYGPKFNFILDHPVWAKLHLMHQYPDFHILTHDNNYVAFAKRYFHKDAVLLPPAGMVSEDGRTWERIYDLSFVGTYIDYWELLLWIHEQDRTFRFQANRFLLIMRKNPDMTAENAFQRMLDDYHLELNDEEFLELFYRCRNVMLCVMHYYRDRVVRAILESGIQVNVFGDTWENCRLRKYRNLIYHPNVTVEESLVIMKQSKLSLNIMSWHKAGFTERMAEIMLAGAVLVTDDTTYLRGEYDEEDMIIFRLGRLNELPDKIKSLLKDDEKRKRIAENGRKKTEKGHTWDRWAEQFLELLQKEEG